MKTIEIDEDLYRYIASHTLHIGESASDILRRLLHLNNNSTSVKANEQNTKPVIELMEQTEKKALVDDEMVTKKGMIKPMGINPVDVVNHVLTSDSFKTSTQTLKRFFIILSTLYKLDNSMFVTAANSIYGRKRRYFADNEQILLVSGRNTKPKQIPDTNYWVITNTNTERKRSIVNHIMSMMLFPPDLIDKVCRNI